MSRGGTNIAWNLIQSHPSVVSPILETGEVVHPGTPGTVLHRTARSFSIFVIRHEIGPFAEKALKKLYSCKNNTLEDEHNKGKDQFSLYAQNEIENAVLVMKSLNFDVSMTPSLIKKFGGKALSVNVVRNPLATCEGWVRRGMSMNQAARWYHIFLKLMLKQGKEVDCNILWYTFDEIIEKPDVFAKEVFSARGLQYDNDMCFRLKRKKTVSEHESGQKVKINDKVWLSVREISEFLDPRIDEKQIKRLGLKKPELEEKLQDTIRVHRNLVIQEANRFKVRSY
jgi:hypothetical protein